MAQPTTGSTDEPASSRGGWRPFAIAGACYLLLAILQTFPLILRLSRVVPHDPGDPLMSTAILWWNAHVLPFTERWWDGFAFYPAKGSLAFSDPRVGEAILASPLQWLGASPAAAYNLTLLATYPLSALAAHWLAFVLTRRHDAAAIAGVAFGFCPFRGAHLAHLELLAAYGMPVALGTLHRYLETRERRWLGLFAVALVVQGLSSSYYLIFFGVLLAVWLAWFIRLHDGRALVEIVVAGAVAAIALLPLALGYTRIHAFHGFERSSTEIALFSADATGLIAADPSLLLWGWTSRFGQLESFIFPGVVLPGLVIVFGIAAWRRAAGHDRVSQLGRWALVGAALAATIAALAWAFDPWRIDLPGLRISSESPYKQMSLALVLFIVWLVTTMPMRRAWERRSTFAFYALATVLLFLCSLGPRPRFAGHEFLYQPPYRWMMSLPAFGSIRVPARFAMAGMLMLATAAAIGFSRLQLDASRRRSALTLALLGIAADGWLAPIPLPALPDAWPPGRANGFAAVIELPLGELFGDLRAMYRATLHGHPTVNGSSGFEPGHYAAVRAAVAEHDPIAFDWLSAPKPVLIVLDRTAADAAEWDRFVSDYPRVSRLPSDARWAFYALAPAAPPPAACNGRALAIRSIASSDAPIDLLSVTDDDPATWWATPRPQREGDSLTIDLGENGASPCALELSVGEFQPAYPRSVVIESSTDERAWTTVAHVRTSVLAIRAALADPTRTAFAIPLTERPARFLRIRLDQTNLTFPWHVAELKVRAPGGDN
jgi:hypothetical protein